MAMVPNYSSYYAAPKTSWLLPSLTRWRDRYEEIHKPIVQDEFARALLRSAADEVEYILPSRNDMYRAMGPYYAMALSLNSFTVEDIRATAAFANPPPLGSEIASGILFALLWYGEFWRNVGPDPFYDDYRQVMVTAMLNESVRSWISHNAEFVWRKRLQFGIDDRQGEPLDFPFNIEG